MVSINGVEKAGYEEKTLSDVLAAETYHVNQIAVEINGEIVSKSLYTKTVVHSGDCIEVVSFVGGG